VNREGTLHIVLATRPTPPPAEARYQVGFADYTSPGGAMKMKEIVGEHALRDLFTSIGVQPRIAESAINGLRSEGSASLLSVILPEERLINLGLADRKVQQYFSVRFTVFQEPNASVLSYSLAGPFIPATFSSKAGARYANMASLIGALDSVGLPGRDIVGMAHLGITYNVTGAQLSTLGLKPPAW
jgi:hypothetical protein